MDKAWPCSTDDALSSWQEHCLVLEGAAQQQALPSPPAAAQAEGRMACFAPAHSSG